MPATKIILTVQNRQQLDQQISELVSGLITTEDGLRKFVMALEKVVQTITSDDYPMPPELSNDGKGAAIYEAYRLGAQWMLKLLLAEGGEGLDIVIVRKD